MCITPTILDELEPGYYLEKKDKSTKEIHTSVSNFSSGNIGLKIIEIIKVSDIKGAKEELAKIRKRFYGWMTDSNYLNLMISDGLLTREEIIKQNFIRKDLGECELIAIAKASKGEYWVITNDKGAVYKHPYLNIFDTYKNDPDVTIVSGEEWLQEIGYIEE